MRLTIEIDDDTWHTSDEIRRLMGSCRVCSLSPGGSNHQTLARCNRYLAREGRVCEYPHEHHEYQPVGRIID